MHHVRLTCENHRDLRWMCKEIAVNADGRYNHSRNIFFLGRIVNGKPEDVIDGCAVKECECPSHALIRIDGE